MTTTPTRENRSPPELANPAATTRERTRFVRETVDDAGADGVVVGLSGGIDSTVAATLAVEALGSDSVYGLVLPAAATTTENRNDALQVAEELVVDYRVIELQPLLDQVVRTVTMQVRESGARRPDGSGRRRTVVDPTAERTNYRGGVGNAAARLRTVLAYFEANTTNRLVLGTGNRTELALGYFTKYGDGGVDLLPLGDLYKSQVRTLARHLDVPDRIVEKPPTAGLWAGQTDEAQLGARYETIDAILKSVLDEGAEIDEAAARLGVDRDLVARYVERHERSAHKRSVPPTPSHRQP